MAKASTKTEKQILDALYSDWRSDKYLGFNYVQNTKILRTDKAPILRVNGWRLTNAARKLAAKGLISFDDRTEIVTYYNINGLQKALEAGGIITPPAQPE